jgi:hypothetical protein
MNSAVLRVKQAASLVSHNHFMLAPTLVYSATKCDVHRQVHKSMVSPGAMSLQVSSLAGSSGCDVTSAYASDGVTWHARPHSNLAPLRVLLAIGYPPGTPSRTAHVDK